MMPETMGCTLVGGPRHGETVSLPIPEVGSPWVGMTERHPTDEGLWRHGRYEAWAEGDAVTGVLRWLGWSEWARPRGTP